MGAPSKVDTSPVVHIQSEELFDTYGPRVQTDSIYAGSVASFIERSLRQDSMRVPGDGTHLRSLCFVSDMVEGLLRFLALDDGAGTVLDFGSDERIQIAEVARMVKRLTSSNATIFEEPEEEPPLDGLVPDITRAKEMLGWTPKQTFRKGLIENNLFRKKVNQKTFLFKKKCFTKTISNCVEKMPRENYRRIIKGYTPHEPRQTKGIKGVRDY